MGFGFQASDGRYNTGDKNVGRAGNKNSRETREQRRDRNALARGRRGEGLPVGSRLRSPPPSPREKKLNAALVPEQNMAHVASRGTIGPVGGEQTEQELHSPPRYSYSSSARYAITERATLPSPRNRIRHSRKRGRGRRESATIENSSRNLSPDFRIKDLVIILIGKEKRKAGFDRVSRNRRDFPRIRGECDKRGDRARIRIMDDGWHRYKRPTFPGRRKL